MQLQHLSPILWTKDILQTKTFYEDILGFRGVSHFPGFISLSRDGVEIMFVVPQDEPEDCKNPGDHEPFFARPVLTGSLFITTDDVDTFWEQVKDKVTVK